MMKLDSCSGPEVQLGHLDVRNLFLDIITSYVFMLFKLFFEYVIAQNMHKRQVRLILKYKYVKRFFVPSRRPI